MNWSKKKKKTKKAQENKTEQTNAFIDPGIIGIIERTNVLTWFICTLCIPLGRTLCQKAIKHCHIIISNDADILTAHRKETC